MALPFKPQQYPLARPPSPIEEEILSRAIRDYRPTAKETPDAK